jgi:hypothetical protein
MDLCNYVQNLYETYLVATDTLKYDIAHFSEALGMYAGGTTVLLFLQPSGWEEPIIEYTGSHISRFEGHLGSFAFIVYISYNDTGKREVHLNYL